MHDSFSSFFMKILYRFSKISSGFRQVGMVIEIPLNRNFGKCEGLSCNF